MLNVTFSMQGKYGDLGKLFYTGCHLFCDLLTFEVNFELVNSEIVFVVVVCMELVGKKRGKRSEQGNHKTTQGILSLSLLVSVGRDGWMCAWLVVSSHTKFHKFHWISKIPK